MSKRAKKKTTTKAETTQPELATTDSPAVPVSPPTISIQDIQTMLAVINVSTERGGFRGNEIKVVGELHEKLSQFLAYVQAQQKEGAADSEA